MLKNYIWGDCSCIFYTLNIEPIIEPIDEPIKKKLSFLKYAKLFLKGF